MPTFAVPGDQIAANLGSVQSAVQPDPVTFTTATTIAPITRLTLLVGSTTLVQITPPITGHHELVFIWTQATTSAITTAGNIMTATTNGVVQNQPVFFEYNPINSKYYVHL